MEAKLFNQSGDEIGTVQLADYIFGITPNVPVMHQSVVRQRANARLGTHNTLRRGEVRGSTRKLYRQKGTGRARQGSVRAPHRKGGGVAHGPHPRSYRLDMPRKMRRLAVRSALSAKFAAEEIRFVDQLAFEQPRTRDMIDCLAALNLAGKTLIVLDRKDTNVQRSANNLPGVKTLLAHYLNVIDLLQSDNILIAQSAVDVIESYLGQHSAEDAPAAAADEDAPAAAADEEAA
jgi:large subunit ribosomal protein L4